MSNIRATAYHNLYVMLDAGLPTLRALDIAVKGQRGRLPRVFTKLTEAISKGEPLAETMAKYPSVFLPLDVTIIDAAETSGNLPEAFKLLSEWYTFTHRMTSKILSGLVFPIAILTIAAFVFPIVNLILGRISFALYLFSAAQTLSFFFIPAAIVYMCMSLIKQEGVFRTIFDYAIVRIPMLGRVIYKLALSRFCRSFQMLYQAGVPIIQSVEKASYASGNAVIRDMLKGGVASAKKGNPISDGFSKSLPIEFIQIWQIGEEAGSLEKSTGRLANIYADSAELALTQFADWLPKVIYFLVSLMVIYMIITLGASMLSSMRNF